MAYYETVFIARQDLTTSQVETLAEEFQTVLTEAGVTSIKKESWGLRTLAYLIKKNRKGHYIMFLFEAANEALFEFERKLRIHEDILRYLTIKRDVLDEAPSIMMQRVEKEEKRLKAFEQDYGDDFSNRTERKEF
jgi:small subunit ribosomal protein S6